MTHKPQIIRWSGACSSEIFLIFTCDTPVVSIIAQYGANMCKYLARNMPHVGADFGSTDYDTRGTDHSQAVAIL